jgi:tRNA-Thr(GGU) m(6)t(6)A37 methyltransferase TsaA
MEESLGCMASMPEIVIRPIGYIKSPISSREEAPCMGSEAFVSGELVVDEIYRDAFLGLEPGMKIMILYWMNIAGRDVLQVHPRRDASRPLRGVFATRSPDRPNPIAVDTVEILEIHDTIIRVCGLDALNGTPLLDIKSTG